MWAETWEEEKGEWEKSKRDGLRGKEEGREKDLKVKGKSDMAVAISITNTAHPKKTLEEKLHEDEVYSQMKLEMGILVRL